jgi:hypothetical protein
MDCFVEPVIGRRYAPTRRLAMTLIGRRIGKASACPPCAIALSMVGTARADTALKPFDNRPVWLNIQY